MFLKNKNITFKSRRSKVTDYTALKAVASNGFEDDPGHICMYKWTVCMHVQSVRFYY